MKIILNLITGDKLESNISSDSIDSEINEIFNNDYYLDLNLIESITTRNAIVLVMGVDQELSKQILKSILKLEAINGGIIQC